jgi:hypothetical protein
MRGRARWTTSARAGGSKQPSLATISSAGEGQIGPAPFQSLGVERHPQPVMPEDLDQTAADGRPHPPPPPPQPLTQHKADIAPQHPFLP